MRPLDHPAWVRFHANLAGRWAVCALPLLAAACAGCNGYPPPTPSHSVVQNATPTATSAGSGFPTLLTPSQAELDFGTLAKGGKGEVTFWLHNSGTSAVEVTRVETSCCCFEVELQEKVIEPEGKVAVRAKVDLAKEPQFVGSLRLEASGLTNSKGIKAFMVCGTVNVASTETGRGK